MTFVNWANEHGIILLILPSHTTHCLQPLDVGMFQPLSTNYSWELDQIMNESEGRVSMSKSFFWPMFKRSWDKTFTEKISRVRFVKQASGRLMTPKF
jgi:spore maturation protein CgeB